MTDFDKDPVTSGRQRPSARDIAAVFGLGVAGTLIPVVGWLIGVWLVLRAAETAAHRS